MEDIKNKYSSLRHEITDGCLVLTSKNKFISKTIKWLDNSEYSHVGLIFKKGERLFILDSNLNGVHPELLSIRIEECDKFCIIKPLCNEKMIEESLVRSFDRAEKKVKYDIVNGLKETLNRKFKTSFKIKQRDNHDICSDWVRDTALYQNMVTYKFKSLQQPLPEDYIRYRNFKTTKIIK